LVSGNKNYPIKFNNAPMKSVDFSCDGRLIVTGSDDKSIKVILNFINLDYKCIG
jgi:WD40 repeat protein